MYQKLFSIEYNNKKFTIFMDKNNRKTFLELTKDNEYVYPKLDDFLYLNKIYNNNDFKFYSIKDFLFKEKVRIASSALAVIVSLNALPTAHALNFQVDNNAVTISNSEVLPEVFISNSKDLDQVLNYKNVSKEEVSKTIDNNSKLTPLVKEALHRILDFITQSDEKADLRIFYENVKTLEANAYTTEEFKTVFNNTAGGAYDAIANKISYIKEAPKGIYIMNYGMQLMFTIAN